MFNFMPRLSMELNLYRTVLRLPKITSLIIVKLLYRNTRRISTVDHRRPFYNYYGTVFRRVGNFVYFLSGQGIVKGVNLTNPQGFVSCVRNVKCFDVDSNGIVSVDSTCNTITVSSILTEKGSPS